MDDIGNRWILFEFDREVGPGPKLQPDGNTGAGGHGSVGKPIVAIWCLAAGDSEEFVLETLGERAAGSVGNRDAINRADRSNFDRSAAEEKLVRDVKHLAGDNLFDDGDV